MSPTIHFVHHAQGFHNVGAGDYSMHDPLLTPSGKEQCARLREVFPYTQDIDLVVASPSKRTIHTALLSFGNIINAKTLTIVALPELQETSDLPCDTGSGREEIAREFVDFRLDLSHVSDDWTSKRGRWAPTPGAIEERAKAARVWLRSRSESNIVVLTHGGVLHYLTEDWTGATKFAGTGWVNTVFRSYTFDPTSCGDAALVETVASRKRRHAPETSLSRAEQRNLQLIAEASWESGGYIA